MKKAHLLAAGAVLGLCGFVALLLFWERAADKPPPETSAQRLLSSLNPTRVRRVELKLGDLQLRLRRQPGGWALQHPPGKAMPLRVEALLTRLHDLSVTGGSGRPLRGRPGSGSKKTVARIKLWQAGGRPLVVYLQRGSRGVVAKAADHSGTANADKLFRWLQRAVSTPAARPLIKLTMAGIKAVSIRRGRKITRLARHSTGWTVLTSRGALQATQPAVNALLRTLTDLRVTHKLGQGAKVWMTYKLVAKARRVHVQGAKKHQLWIGGSCPRSQSGTVMAVGDVGSEVVCASPFDPRMLERDFVSRRLFSTSPGEVAAVVIRSGERRLQLRNRSGGGGWKLEAAQAPSVDQAAVEDFVASLTQLRLSDNAATAPAKDTAPTGEITVTPLQGKPETVAVLLDSAGTPWARRAKDSLWRSVDPAAKPLLTADPVTLRSQRVCAERTGPWLFVVKNAPRNATEVLTNDGAWQLAVLAGRPSATNAVKLIGSLESYRVKATDMQSQKATAWRAPVLLAGAPDLERVTQLGLALDHVRAIRYVSSKATTEHGLGQLGLVAQWRSCAPGAAGKPRRCQPRRCALDIGRRRRDGTCYARRTGDPAVFLAPAPLCRAATRPVITNRVVALNLPQVKLVTLRRPKQVARFSQTEGVWRRLGKASLSHNEAASLALLRLAPLDASEVLGYYRQHPGKTLLEITIRVPQVPPVRLRIVEPPQSRDEGRLWIARKGVPVRYAVSSELVRDIRKLLE